MAVDEDEDTEGHSDRYESFSSNDIVYLVLCGSTVVLFAFAAWDNSKHRKLTLKKHFVSPRSWIFASYAIIAVVAPARFARYFPWVLGVESTGINEILALRGIIHYIILSD